MGDIPARHMRTRVPELELLGEDRHAGPDIETSKEDVAIEQRDDELDGIGEGSAVRR
jgi:hypothetical protein